MIKRFHKSNIVIPKLPEPKKVYEGLVNTDISKDLLETELEASIVFKAVEFDN